MIVLVDASMTWIAQGEYIYIYTHTRKLLTPRDKRLWQKVWLTGGAPYLQCVVGLRDTSIELHADKMHTTIFLFDTDQPILSRIMYMHADMYMYLYIYIKRICKRLNHIWYALICHVWIHNSFMLNLLIPFKTRIRSPWKGSRSCLANSAFAGGQQGTGNCGTTW